MKLIYLNLGGHEMTDKPSGIRLFHETDLTSFHYELSKVQIYVSKRIIEQSNVNMFQQNVHRVLPVHDLMDYQTRAKGSCF